MASTAAIGPSRLFILLVVLLGMAGFSHSVELNLCSSDNTSDGDAETSTYQSNGNCENVCSGYAFSITQGKQCWCSNYAPADTVSVSDCDEECPGYPYEYCGSTSGLYGYVRLSAEPSGTVGSSSSSTDAASSSSQASATERTVLQTVTETSIGSVFVTVTPTPLSSSSSPESTSSSVSSSSATTPTTTVTTTATPTTSSDPTTSTTSTTHSTTSSASAQTVTNSPVTSIVTIPGQTQVSTIIITPSSSATADTSPLGQGTSNSSSNSLSKGAVAGIAIGVALGVTLIAAVILLFLWRRMKQRRAESEAGNGPDMVGTDGSPNSVSRHTSQMSQSGLLAKGPRLNTRAASNGLHSSGHSGSTVSPTATTNRRSIGADQRLDAYHPIYTHENLQHSDVSLQDNTDYSRKILAVRNPGPEVEES